MSDFFILLSDEATTNMLLVFLSSCSPVPPSFEGVEADPAICGE
eukprot:CAMPEP_0204003430 /NCGR_PEP_ID=MMETSP0360-20130528/17644_1 /ASSEMBLY_ACC=CAM_ASM_000342 /TAXON_ID=268821 /ORGANISM="Scrippsiella Hangoei, Strain SHTV-5" /LENGTH=43 /DNA_ID= /DNA_START= /DNA_END= /DNA_ORIENTATION=